MPRVLQLRKYFDTNMHKQRFNSKGEGDNVIHGIQNSEFINAKMIDRNLFIFCNVTNIVFSLYCVLLYIVKIGLCTSNCATPINFLLIKKIKIEIM